jgi:hypothetical protein
VGSGDFREFEEFYKMFADKSSELVVASFLKPYCLYYHPSIIVGACLLVASKFATEFKDLNG